MSLEGGGTGCVGLRGECAAGTGSSVGSARPTTHHASLPAMYTLIKQLLVLTLPYALSYSGIS